MSAQTDVDVVILGAGFSGMGMAIALRQEGCRSFVVLEKEQDVGGTWWVNTYPGCACDVQSHLYSYSFEPNPRWSRMFAPQPEIRAYLHHCADHYGLRPFIRTGQNVTQAEFDPDTHRWRVMTSQGDTFTGRFLVCGLGTLSRPAIPDIPGLENFGGKTFHSAQWDHGHDLTSRRVAVLGTGASAIQFVPRIAQQVKQLHLFQRTPPWILPKPDRAIEPGEQRLYATQPWLQALRRASIYWALEMRVLAFVKSPILMRAAQAVARRHIRKHVRDPHVQDKLIPNYTIGCKRVLISNDYYPTFNRPNVELVTDAVTAVDASGITTAEGTHRAVDTIILGTGFKAAETWAPMKVIGPDGTDLNDTWASGLSAYLGTTVSGYPNLFIMTGPNTILGHSSMVFMIESQLRYVLDAFKKLDAAGASAVAVRPEVQSRYNNWLHARLRGSVWDAGGCRSWYLDRHGNNVTLWPGFTWEFRRLTRRFNLADYMVLPSRSH